MATTTLDSFRPRAEVSAIAQQPPIKPKLKKAAPDGTVVICLICGWKGDTRQLLRGNGNGLDCPGGHPGASSLVIKEDFEDPKTFASTRTPATIEAARLKRKELKLKASPEVLAFERKVVSLQEREHHG